MKDKYKTASFIGDHRVTHAKTSASGWTILGVSLVGIGVFAYFAFFVFGMASAILSGPNSNGDAWPLIALLGIVVGLPLIGFGILVVKVVVDRLKSSEDNYYSKNVER